MGLSREQQLNAWLRYTNPAHFQNYNFDKSQNDASTSPPYFIAAKTSTSIRNVSFVQWHTSPTASSNCKFTFQLSIQRHSSGHCFSRPQCRSAWIKHRILETTAISIRLMIMCRIRIYHIRLKVALIFHSSLSRRNNSWPGETHCCQYIIRIIRPIEIYRFWKQSIQ